MDGSLRDNTDIFSERRDPNAIKVCEFHILFCSCVYCKSFLGRFVFCSKNIISYCALFMCTATGASIEVDHGTSH